MRTIMVAVDDSPAAFRAATVAVDLARRLSARLVAVTVVDGQLAGEPVPGRLRSPAEHPAGQLAARRQAAQAAQQHVRVQASQLGVQIELRTTQGHVADALLEQAREISADLVVIGRAESARVHLGHVGHTAEQVLEFSTVPVLVVPGPGG